jgi:eukaryotic-like serine/threonine-protein kinase
MVAVEPKKLKNHCEVCRAPEACTPCARCRLRPPDAAELLASAAEENRPNAIVLEGKYRLLDEIGRGGMGTVFRAVDESLNRVVAVKFLLPELQEVPLAVEWFRKEAQALAQVRHHNVLRLYTYGRHGTAHFFVTEYIDGQSGEDIVQTCRQRGEHLPLRRAVALLDQACAGLHAIHRAGVIHRDVKPGNIMVEAYSERVVIMDFGLGRMAGSGGVAGPAKVGGGTPAYMAPELLDGQKQDPARAHLADVYALGVTAFEVLTLSLPFTGEHFADILVQHLDAQPPLPSSRRPGLPAALDEVVLRCLAKDPAARPASAEQVRLALREAARSAAEI